MSYRKQAIEDTRSKAILNQETRKLTYMGPGNREEIFLFDSEGIMVGYTCINAGSCPVKLNREEREVIGDLPDSLIPLKNLN